MRRILCDAGFIRLEPLTADEIVGTADDSGLIARYFALGTEGIVTTRTCGSTTDDAHRRNRSLCLHTSPTWTTCRARSARNPLRTALHGPARLPPVVRCTCGGLLLDIRTSTTNTFVWTTTPRRLQKLERSPPEHAVTLWRVLACQLVNQPRVDRPLPERSPFRRVPTSVRCTLQRHGSGADDAKRRSRHLQRRGLASSRSWLHAAPPQHRSTVPALFWAGDTGSAGGASREESFPTLSSNRPSACSRRGTAYRSSLSPFGIKIVGSGSAETAAPRHQRPADEARYHDQPQQIRAGSFGQRQVVLHEPPDPPLLRARGRTCCLSTREIPIKDCANSSIAAHGARNGIYLNYTDEAPIVSTPSTSRTGCTTSRSGSRSRR